MNTSENTYNGWANRETWLANLWYNPEIQKDVDWMEEDIEEKYSQLDGFLRDMINIQIINFDEIRKSLDDYED